MKKLRLDNGVQVFLEKTSSPTVTIQANITVGSVHESRKEAGYAHFLEHMLFEGTKKRTNFQIANEVESVGGELNGATTSDRTLYYIKVPKKHAQKALDIIIDILTQPLFGPKIFSKEKKVILSEIHLYNDDPKLYQWILLEKNLFSSNLRLSALGTESSITEATNESIKNFYHTYYTGENIFLTISGNFSKLSFSQLNAIKKGKTSLFIEEGPLKKDKKIVVKRKISQSYIILGYKTPQRDSYDSFVVDVIHAVLGRGVSGKLFHEIRNKRGLGYNVHVVHEASKFAGMFAIAVSTKKVNLKKVEDIAKREINKLKKINSKELNEAKEYIIGKLAMELEDTRNRTDWMALWIAYSTESSMRKYLSTIKRVSKNDIKNSVDKYFKRKVTVIIKE